MCAGEYNNLTSAKNKRPSTIKRPRELIFLFQVVGPTNESLLHLVARGGLEEAGLFLTTQGADCNVSNADGESPLHISCTVGLPSLTTALLQVNQLFSCLLWTAFIYSFIFIVNPEVAAYSRR